MAKKQRNHLHDSGIPAKLWSEKRPESWLDGSVGRGACCTSLNRLHLNSGSRVRVEEEILLHRVVL